VRRPQGGESGERVTQLERSPALADGPRLACMNSRHKYECRKARPGSPDRRHPAMKRIDSKSCRLRAQERGTCLAILSGHG